MRHATKVFAAFAVLLVVASALPDGAEGDKTSLLDKLSNKFHHEAIPGSPTSVFETLLFTLEWRKDVSDLDFQVDGPDQTIAGEDSDCFVGEVTDEYNLCNGVYAGDFQDGPPGLELVNWFSPVPGKYTAIVRYYAGTEPAEIRVTAYPPGLDKVVLTKPEWQTLGIDDTNSVDLNTAYPAGDWGTDDGNGNPINRGAIFTYTFP